MAWSLHLTSSVGHSAREDQNAARNPATPGKEEFYKLFMTNMNTLDTAKVG